MIPAQEAANIIDAIAADSDPSECVYYQHDILYRSCDESLSIETRNYLEVVGKVASYHFKHENTHEPYGPIFQSRNGRSAIPADLGDEDLTQLQKVCEYLSTMELVARTQDILWLRQKKLDFAEKAITTYLRCAEASFDLDNWVFSAACVERVLRLASIHRRKKSEWCQSVANVLIKWIQQHADSDKKYLTARAIDLVSQFGYGNVSDLYIFSTKIANIAEKDRDFHRAEEYWKLAVDCARRAKDSDATNIAQTALAECYAENARTHKNSGMIASHWMQQAVEAYKSVPDSKEKRKRLYSELLEYQKVSLSEIKPIQHSQDISDIVQTTMRILEGKTVREAIFILV